MQSEDTRNVVGICRAAAEAMISERIQWRLDPKYILALCDTVAALSDKQAGETFTREQMLAEVDRRVERALAARSALVDVPAVEPVAWMDDGTCRAGSDSSAHRVVTDAQKRDMPEAIASSFTTPLFASPPLSREGENSAEVIAELLRHLDKIQSNAIRAGELAWHPNSPLAESIEKVRALAATRSGSATTQTGATPSSTDGCKNGE